MTQTRKLIFLILLFLSTTNFAQFKINQLSSGFDQLNDSLFLGITNSRTIQNLNNDWNVFFADEPEKSSIISFPVSFTSHEPIVFQKEFVITSEQQLLNIIKLNFLGINYSAEIFVNNAAVYKHPGGELPFSIDLPENILNYDSPNLLRIKIQYTIDSENTIPLLQRFLFPKSIGGIFRDVYLSFRPKAGIKNVDYYLEDDKRPYEKRINFQVNLEEFSKIVSDSLLENFDGRFKLEASLKTTTDTSRIYFNIWNINPTNKENFSKSFYVRLRKLSHWDTKIANSYKLSVKLTNGDGYIYDEHIKLLSVMDFKKSNNELLLNNNPYIIKGVTYIRSFDDIKDYEQLEKDIATIKETGFNTIRFSKSFPHLYSVYLSHKYGLLSFIELPLNSVPERMAESKNFEERATSFLGRAIDQYKKYPNVVAYGLGGSYLGNSKSHSVFVSNINKYIKSKDSQLITYGSFIGTNNSENIDIDLYGFELFASPTDSFIEKFNQPNPSDTIIYFISEATYPTFMGATNGYLNNYSFEGQAKYFDDIISISEQNNLRGFFLNTMFDYKGDYSPLFAGYNDKKLYNIGIFSDEGSKSRISYNLIRDRLNSQSKVSVPIGSNDEDAPLFFIITALIISVIIALLINSKRKFREDATRALLRPYNFYADIRDQRILSGFHSNILMFLLAGVNALLVTILLYFLKTNILFDKIVIAFGDYDFSSIVGVLAWHPQEAFIYTYVGTICLFIIMSFFVHLSSFFVKTKVLYSSVYSVAIWAFLPLALLLPIEAVLYKVLLTQTYNYYIYIILLLFLVWNIQRFLKGIYVIFDVRPLFIYSWAFLILVTFVLGFGIYFQYTVSAFDYISLAIKQYILL